MTARQFWAATARHQSPRRWNATRLDNRAGAGLDPAAALQVEVSLERGAQVEVVFLLGEAGSAEEARAIISRYQTPEQVEQRYAATRNSWESTLGALQVRTPVLSTDFLLNRWLPYQALSCRFWARSALYQSSGAFGFRDQLQDSMAFVYARPGLTRAHILRRPAGNSSKAMCSIGGIPKPAWESARAVPTTAVAALRGGALR